MKEPMSPAQLCRRNGWTVGTKLVGDEGYGEETIIITAIGECLVLARKVDGSANNEGLWALCYRIWRKA